MKIRIKVNQLMAMVLCGILLLAGCGQNDGISSTDAIPESSLVDKSSSGEKVVEFKADDYGLVGDGETDNAPMLAKLVAKLRFTVGKKRVLFSKGTYFFSPAAGTILFDLNGIQDLEICGVSQEDTRFVLDNNKAAVAHFANCQNIMVRDFSVEWAPIPFTQGVIVAKNPGEGTFDLKIDEGYPSPQEDWFQQAAGFGESGVGARWGVLIDRDTKDFKDGVQDTVFVSKEVENLGGGVYRFRAVQHGVAAVSRDMEVGDRYTQIIRTGELGGIHMSGSKDVLVENITFRRNPGMSVVSVASEGVQIKNVSILKTGTDYIASAADGFHFRRNRSGPVIENCHIEGLCDDAINISEGGLTNVIDKLSDTELLVDNIEAYQEGDTIFFFEPIQGEKTDTAKILSIAKADDGNYRIVFDKALQGIVDKSQSAVPTMLFNQNAMGAGFVIRNNQFGRQRVRQMLIQSQNGLIENNIMDGGGSYAMLIANEAVYPSGSYPDKMVIRGNTITHASYNRKPWKMYAAIVVATMRYPGAGDEGYVVARSRCTTDIEITDNQISDSYYHAIYLGAVQGAVIRNNTFSTTADFTKPDDSAFISLYNCGAVKIETNRFTQDFGSLYAGIEIDDSTDADDAGITLKGNTFSLPEGVPEITDAR